MARSPNEEIPSPLVSDSYVPPGSQKRRVGSGESWMGIAASLKLDPWDLIDFNFPGLKRVHLADHQRATRQVNWYLSHYIGCNSSKDGENWDFASGLTGGSGIRAGGNIYLPTQAPPPVPPTRHVCNPTKSGKMGRRPTSYRLLSPLEQAMVKGVFGQPFPYLSTVGIGNGLGFEGRPWTDIGPIDEPGLDEQLQYQINMGDAASADLTSKLAANCYVAVDGTLSDLLIHEMTHVWQYYTKGGMTGRYRVWASSVGGSYKFTPGDPWNSYDVEQQATIVEKWFNNGALKNDPLYPYIALVLQSRGGALDYASDLTLNELTHDLAQMRK